MQDEVPTIECAFLTEAALYQAYMPFLLGGGIFVRMHPILVIGDTVTLSVQVLNDAERYLINARVVWCTPKGAQGNKPAGIGFQFTGENTRHFSNKIETCLAGMLKSTNPTDTM